MNEPGTSSILIVLTVPEHWATLSEQEIARKLEHNRHELLPFLAKEVKRWGLPRAGVLDLTALKKFVDDRIGS